MGLHLTKSLALKLLAVSVAVITIILVATFTFIVYTVRERAVNATLDQAQLDAKGTAQGFDAKMSALVGATRTMAGDVQTGLAQGYLTREMVTAQLPGLIDRFDLVFGSWMTEMEKGFDGKVENGASEAKGTNASGVFTPYWTRSDTGKILVLPEKLDYSAPYITLATKAMATAATEPYQEANANNLLMMSISEPVAVNGVVRGVLGIDIGLGTLADSLKNERPFGTGRVYLLSAEGKWLTAPDEKLVMQPYAQEGADQVKQALADGKVAIIKGVIGADGAEVYRVVYPFALSGLNTRWQIVEDVPVAVVSAVVNQQTLILVLSGLVILVAVVVALLLAVRLFIQTPLAALLGEVGRLSAGRYDEPVIGQNRGDEVGALATSLESFRHKLAEGRQLEATNERQRLAAEHERGLTEQERAAAAEVQSRIVDALGHGLSKLSDGDLSYRIEQSFPGSYARLRDDFNTALASMEQMIARLNQSAHTITDGSGEISRSTDQLAKRTEQQAASLEESAAALGEIGEKLNETAKNASEAAKKVTGACADAERSSQVVQRAVAAMEGIKDSSDKVSQIIGVIDEIAFQTNLLALNAGVEAARAGEAGKGFAVVAQEVRELAQRSANAAKEIKSLISASGDQVQHGVSLVGETGDALTRIADQVQGINGLIQHISMSSQEQASGLREINIAVNQMDQMTQQNAAMVEETSAASMILNDEARTLSEMVTHFKISGAIRPSARRAA